MNMKNSMVNIRNSLIQFYIRIEVHVPVVSTTTTTMKPVTEAATSTMKFVIESATTTTKPVTMKLVTKEATTTMKPTTTPGTF